MIRIIHNNRCNNWFALNSHNLFFSRIDKGWTTDGNERHNWPSKRELISELKKTYTMYPKGDNTIYGGEWPCYKYKLVIKPLKP